MISKNNFAFTGIFLTLVLSLAIVSATTSGVFSITNVSFPANVSETAGSFTFTFNLTYTGDSTSKDFTFSDSSSTIGTVSIPDTIGLDGTVGESMIVTGTVTGFSNQGGNSMAITINASSGATRDDETIFVVNILDNTPTPSTERFCEFGEKGTLDIIDFSVDNLGEGSDEEWEPLDEIEIEIEIENTDEDDSVKDVIVEIKIMDGDKDITKDFDLENDEIDLGKISEDDSEVALFKITEVPADLEEGDYRIYIKAYSEGDEDIQCASESSDFDNSANSNKYHEIEIVREEDQAVIIRDIEDKKILATCGDEAVEVKFTVYNIGIDKEEKILVRLTNKELGIDEVEVMDDVRSGKKEEISFFVNIPENLTKIKYDLEATTYYEYDEDEDELSIFAYDSNSDDDLDKTYKIPVEILSCGVKEPSIDATLESGEAKVGEEIVIKASISNEGNTEEEFLVSISDFGEWAELSSEEVQTLKIAAGKTEEFTIKIVPSKEGLQSFSINAIVNGESFDQSISVNVAEKESVFSFGKVNDPVVYLIGGIILLVILIIITLIVKMSRRSRRAQFSDLA